MKTTKKRYSFEQKMASVTEFKSLKHGGLTGRDAAQKIGIRYNMLRRWENGSSLGGPNKAVAMNSQSSSSLKTIAKPRLPRRVKRPQVIEIPMHERRYPLVILMGDSEQVTNALNRLAEIHRSES